jgi:amino acid adenylation domain-containing protein
MTNAGAGDLDQNLFALFARQAARRPDAKAVIDDTGATTYGALLTRACVIADALTQRGLGAEQPVGVLMKRTSDLLAALLGILGAGGCYVPLDPEDPPERTRRMVDGAKCQLVLGHRLLLEEFRSRLHGAGDLADTVELVDVERYAAAATIAASSEAADPRSRLPNADAPGGHRLAYVLFTSGSTGTPKGVEVEHRNVVNLLLAGRDLFGFTESDRWLATSTVAFDLSVAELFLPLVTGGVVVLRDRRLLQDPHGLVKVIRDHGVTMFQTVPSVWSVLLSEIPDFPRIRVIATTGEAAAPDLARRLVDVADEVWNLYGPTETTVWATGHRLQRNETDRLSASVPIGRPLANVKARVLDEHRMPVPAGTEGELWIGGAGLGRGYCGNEQLTRERFAVLEQDGRRFYRTGDVVVADVDGTLHYFGRCDDQMKIRGVRIEPMEVESAILACPGVTQAAATWFATASGSRSIVAAVVARPDLTISAEDLHRFLEQLLPSAMVPSRFVFCDALPMSPSGKVDRKAIRARVADLPADPATASGREALTVTEGTLIGIWERTLNIRPVGRGDHFFTIGGDSLSAVTMMLEVEATFDISLPFRVAFEAPTLERLGERIDRAQAQQLARMNAPLQTDELGNAAFVFPLSQQGRGIPIFFNNVNLRMAHKGLWDLDCPLYAVSQWAQGSGFAKAKSVEELARVQIDGIRSIQPHGPYRLAGYSFGGLVALEIAHQLRRAGETIELLFLLDPSEPLTDGYLLRPWIQRHMQQLASNPRNALPYVGTRALAILRRAVWEWIGYHLVHFYGRHPNPISARLLPKNRWPAFWYTTQRLGRAYNPQPYDGEVLAMFISHQERRAMWQKLLGPTADIRTFDSDHLGMFAEPALSLWLQPLRATLKESPDIPADACTLRNSPEPSR